MSREAIRKAIKNLNIIFSQFENGKFNSKRKSLEFKHLIIYNLENFIRKSRDLYIKEDLSEIDISTLLENYSEILSKIKLYFKKLNFSYKFPKLFETGEITEKTTMTDAIQTVLKVMNTVYDGDPRRVGLLPTILSQIDLIETAVTEADQIPIAVNAIKTRLSGDALTAAENCTTFAQIRNTLRASCSGEPSWNLATELQGVRYTNSKEKYIQDLDEITKRLKYAYLSEGTAPISAEKYTVNETVKNIKTNFSNNTVMVSAMNNNFNSVAEIFQRFRTVQNDKEVQVLQVRGNRDFGYQNNNFRGSNRNNFRGSNRNNSRGSNRNNFRGSNRNNYPNNYNNNNNNSNNYSSNRNNNGNNYRNNTNGNQNSGPRRYNVRTIEATSQNRGNSPNPQNQGE
jgi:hypothetical protein